MKTLTKSTPPGQQRATLKDVARRAGLSVSAVSYALRGAANIPPATAERVRRAAEALGYRPQPSVGELMAYIRRGRPLPAGERLAFLWMDAPWRKRPFGAMWTGVRARAQELGYGVEEFWLREPDLVPARLHTILRTRGIRGVVLSPLTRADRFTLDWDWSTLSAVILGNAAGSPELHRTGHHHFAGMQEALARLAQAGHRRVAGWISRRVDERAKRAWSAAFLAHHPLPGSARRLLWVDDDDTPGRKRRWGRGPLPEAWITHQARVPLLPGLTGGRPVVVVDRQPGAGAPAGIDQCEGEIARHAVDLLVAQLQRNETGIPTVPTQLLIPGRWRAAGHGET